MGGTPGVFDEKSAEFHLKEYEGLRREINFNEKEARALERYIVVAIGGILTWLASMPKIDRWIWCVPCLLAVLGAVRAFGVNQTWDVYHRYILKLENAFTDADAPGGWEHFLEKEETHNAKGAVLFWALLIFSAGAVAVLRFLDRI
jgi:hypothetical protein